MANPEVGQFGATFEETLHLFTGLPSDEIWELQRMLVRRVRVKMSDSLSPEGKAAMKQAQEDMEQTGTAVTEVSSTENPRTEPAHAAPMSSTKTASPHTTVTESIASRKKTTTDVPTAYKESIDTTSGQTVSIEENNHPHVVERLSVESTTSSKATRDTRQTADDVAQKKYEHSEVVMNVTQPEVSQRDGNEGDTVTGSNASMVQETDSESSNPADINKSSNPSDIHESSSPSDIAESSSLTDVKENSNPADVKENSNPADVKESSSLTDVKENSSLTDVKENSSLTDVKENSSPADVKEDSSIADVKESSSPADVKENSSPADVNESSSPADVKENSSPSTTHGHPSQTEGEDNA